MNRLARVPAVPEPEKEPEEKPKESEESIQKRALEARAQFKQKGRFDNLIIFMVLHELMIKGRIISSKNAETIKLVVNLLKLLLR